MQYQRITLSERNTIYRLRRMGFSLREIAEHTNKNASSICRELKRNTSSSGAYHVELANQQAKYRAHRPQRRKLKQPIENYIIRKLKLGYTPAMIKGRCESFKVSCVSAETIYQYIYEDRRLGGELWQYLTRSHKQRQRRLSVRYKKGAIPNQRMINERPKEVESREEFGHWEGDLINGKHRTGNLVTSVERKARYSLVGRIPNKEAATTRDCICELYQSIPSKARLSLTLDNGKEFFNHEEITKRLGMPIYFAFPYHSWERGTNENTNGLIRRIYPKKSSFATICEAELQFLDCYLNDRPKKCLGWKTPREVFNEELAKL